MYILKDKKSHDLNKYNGNNNTDDTLRLQRVRQYVATSLKYKVVINQIIYSYIIHLWRITDNYAMTQTWQHLSQKDIHLCIVRSFINICIATIWSWGIRVFVNVGATGSWNLWNSILAASWSRTPIRLIKIICRI